MNIIRKNSLHNDQSGVTLVEMLVVMGLLSAMLVVIATIFTSTVDVQQESRSYSATVSNGRFIIARLNYDIARASSIVTPSTLGATSPSLELNIGGANYTYAISGNSLQLTDSTGTDNLTSNDVTISAANFQELGNIGGQPTVLYSFTLISTAKSHGTSDTETFSGTAGLR